MKKLFSTLVLIALFTTPALPAGADGGPATPGLFGWLQSWWNGVVGSVTGDAGPTIDPYGLTGESSGDEGDGGPQIDPMGLTGESSGDGGPQIDPAGLTDGSSADEGDGGGQIDPMG